jgi:hypothetical protein
MKEELDTNAVIEALRDEAITMIAYNEVSLETLKQTLPLLEREEFYLACAGITAALKDIEAFTQKHHRQPAKFDLLCMIPLRLASIRHGITPAKRDNAAIAKRSPFSKFINWLITLHKAFKFGFEFGYNYNRKHTSTKKQ